MRRAVFLDFSIPLFEKDSNLKNFAHHLKDLARYIDKTNNTKFYISISLEFVSTFKDDLQPLIDSIRKLIREERVEFVIRDSFDVNSLKFTRSISEFNFILNEYLLGYFFGDKRNFEGDPSIMIKNLVSVNPYNGIMSRTDVSFLSGMGYSNFLVDKNLLPNSSYIFDNNIFISVDYNFSHLFSSFVDKEVLDSYLLTNISDNYMVYHINAYNLYLNNLESFNINVSNLFHLLDLTDKVEFRFADEFFEMPVSKEIMLLDMSSEESDLFKYQDKLAQFMKLDLPQSIDLTMFDDLRTVSLWESTGNRLIDEYLRTSFLMLTLLSNSINSKINLLNKHLVAHLASILNELEVYSKNNQDLKISISEYLGYINQK
jgi:hypothetical protein